MLFAVVAGVLMTVASRKLAFRTGFLNYPNPIVAQHVLPVPYLGGVAVALAALATLGAGWFYPDLAPVPVVSPSPLLLVGSLLFLMFGLVDDAFPWSPFNKLFCQSGLALALLLAFHPGEVENTSYWLVLFMYVIWIVAVVNAVNFTDVCDGLVTGLCLVSLVAVAIVRPNHAFWALALVGALAGFLVFNFPPAKIYLGDAGSHFLGYSLAIMVLPERWEDAGLAEWAFGPMALGVFLFELVFITKMRLNKGLKWWRGSPDHFSLRMQAAGIPKSHTIGLAWLAAIPWVGAAVIWQWHPDGAWPLLMTGFVILEAVLVWRWLRDLECASRTRVE